MDWTGRPEFAVNFRIATIKTTFTHGNIVLQADIAGFPISVIYAGSHIPHFQIVQAGIISWRLQISFLFSYRSRR